MNSNMTNIHAHCNPFFSVIGKCCIVETTLWKDLLKYIRDLGTVSPVAVVMLMSVLMLEI